ncbi:MAG: hypothetical protein V4637_07650 [Pseudomonadota bacterium]
MELQATLPALRQRGNRTIHSLLVRANAPLFYSVAVASLLEATSSQCAQRLLHLVREDAALSTWVADVWLPGKVARSQALRDYVERKWPEFDWARASEQHLARATANGGGVGPRHAIAAHELLSRCMAAAQSGLFYRVLAGWADDAELGEMLSAMAHGEAQSLDVFRGAYEARARTQRVGFTLAWRMARACVRTARDMHVQLAFRAISAQCGANMSFPALSYADFLARLRLIIQRHGAIGLQGRVLLSGWKNPPASTSMEAPKHRVPKWFKPLFEATA